ncbi:MAG TPA: hypothetical protein VGI40_00140 [Pirellulaceae bacterium]|jgi:hypothetical protein
MDVEKHRSLVFVDNISAGYGSMPFRCVRDGAGNQMTVITTDGISGDVIMPYDDDSPPDPSAGLQIVPSVGRFPRTLIGWDGQPGMSRQIEAMIFPDLARTHTMVTWKGQNFEVVSTEWENQNSPLVNPSLRPEPTPLIDNCGVVIGYYLKKVNTHFLFTNDAGEVFYATQLTSSGNYNFRAQSIIGQDLYITGADSVERYAMENGVRHTQVSSDRGVSSTHIVGGYKYRVKADKWADVLVDIDGFVHVLDTYGDVKPKSIAEKYNGAADKIPLLGWLLPRLPVGASDECWSDDWRDDEQMDAICQAEKAQAIGDSLMLFMDILSFGESAVGRKLLGVGRRAMAWGAEKIEGGVLRSARSTVMALTLEIRAPEAVMTASRATPLRGHLDPRLHGNVVGKADATVAADAEREIHQANRFAERSSEVKRVYLGEAAKKAFKSPAGEKFPDVVARKFDGTFGVGEGKGTDMPKVIKQFEAAKKRLPGSISEQEVVVQKLTDQPVEGGVLKSPGHGYGVDNDGFLLDATSHVDLKHGLPPKVIVNGLPIKVIVMP